MRHRRMKVEVLVSVDVVESKPRCLIGAKLRFDLRADLRPNRWPRAYLKPEARKVGAQMPACVNEIGQPFGRQRRPTVDEYQMQTDAQTGETARARDRIRRGSGGDHQACRREDALLMRQFHGGIDLGRKPKIVGRDD
jgi:hypothetical protein